MTKNFIRFNDVIFSIDEIRAITKSDYSYDDYEKEYEDYQIVINKNTVIHYPNMEDRDADFERAALVLCCDVTDNFIK